MNDNTDNFFKSNSIKMDKVFTGVIGLYLLLEIFSMVLENMPENRYLCRPGENYLFFQIPVVILNLSVIVVQLVIKGKFTPWFRYVCVTCLTLDIFLSSSLSTFDMPPFLIVPVFVALFYYDTLFVGITSLLLLVSRIAGMMIYNRYFLDEDFYFMEQTSKEMNFLVKTMSENTSTVILIILFAGCVFSTHRLRKTLENEFKKNREKAAMEQDIQTAGKIQERMLIKDFPDEKEYSVFATMIPTRQVGGDFYDFIKLEDNKVALVVADVAGKGMQASLVMAVCKTLIKVYVLEGNTTDKILEKTNTFLTASAGRKRPFVTVWMGILDLKTGMLSFTDAGHNPPCISRNGGGFELLKSKINFVVGGKPLRKYSENFLKLSPGDRIFLYTDGVTESRNKDGDFFKEDAMLKVLNSMREVTTKETVEIMLEALKEHSDGTEQYDDITMLAFEFKEYKFSREPEKEIFRACKETLGSAMEFIRKACLVAGCDEGITKQIEIASSEVIANICMYAYEEEPGEYEVSTEVYENEMILRFADSGRFFNPLEMPPPDVTRKLSEREFGGLGIHIVHKLMNDVEYRYENGKNILTLKIVFR